MTESNKLGPKSETHFKAISRNCKKKNEDEADSSKKSRVSEGEGEEEAEGESERESKWGRKGDATIRE